MLQRIDLRRLTIFPKIVITFFICILPFYFLGLNMLTSSSRALETQITESMTANLQYYLSSLESEMQKVIDLKQAYIVDDDFQKLADLASAMSDFEKTQAINRIQDRLALMKTSSLFVDEASVYFPSLQRTITTTGYHAGWSEEQLAAMVQSQAYGLHLFADDGNVMSTQIYPELYTPPYRIGYALQVHFSEERIRHHLSQLLPSAHGGALLMGERGELNLYTGEKESEQLLTDWVRQIDDTERLQGRQYIERAGQRSYLVIYNRSQLLGITIAVGIPAQEALGSLDKYQSLYLIQLAVTIIVIVIFSYWIYRNIHRPLRRLLTGFRSMERGNLDIQFTHRYRDEFDYLYNHFNRMTQRLKRLIQEVYEQKMQSQRAELKQLQSQINPHFLYNSFFVLHRLAQIPDIESVKRMTTHLGEYFRFITRTDGDEVELQLEISHARSYSAIQTLRFGSTIHVEFAELDPAYAALKVPRLIVQPIIENAYKHSLEDLPGQGQLRVQFQYPEGELVITVEDNGTSMTDDALAELRRKLDERRGPEEVTGLLNVHRRLRLKFGEPAGVMLDRSPALGGLRVTMRLPAGKRDSIDGRSEA